MSDLTDRIGLLDVPGLEGLGRTCRELGVHLTAHGGLVRRLAQATAKDGVSVPPDVFDLTPFGSDVDLVHSGPPEQTPAVRDSIQAQVAGSEALRWEIRSEAEDLIFRQAVQVSGIVPANLLRLSSRPGSGIEDPWNGLDDVAARDYRFLRNGFYSTSPLLKAGRDLEIFSALLYLRAVADAGLAVDEELRQQPGAAEAREVLETSTNRVAAIRLQDSSYLRARLRQLLRNLAVAVPAPERPGFAYSSGLTTLLEFLKEEVPALREDADVFDPPAGSAAVASERLGGDTYRLPSRAWGWRAGAEAEEQFARTAARRRGHGKLKLARRHRAVLASQPLPIETGSALREDYLGDLEPDSPHELVEFAIPLPEGSSIHQHAAEDLAMVFALLDQEETLAFFSSPSAGWFQHRDRVAEAAGLVGIRGSCFRVLERAAHIAQELDAESPPSLQVFLVHWQGGR